MYIDCYTPTLHGLTTAPWFAHSAMLRLAAGDPVDPAELSAFCARFSINPNDVAHVSETAALLRRTGPASSRHFQRSFATDRNGMVERLGEDEVRADTDETTTPLLFFPRELDAGKKAVPLPGHVVVLRAAASTGGTDQIVSRVRISEKELVGALLDIRLPGTMLALAADAPTWYATFPSLLWQRGTCIANLASGLSRGSFTTVNAPAVGLNPALFFAPLPMDALSNRVAPHPDSPPATPMLLSASLLMALLRHDAHPYTGGAALDAHAALLIFMQQADFGIECYARHATDGTADALQQYANVVIAFCLLNMPTAWRASRPMAAPLSFSTAILTFTAALKQERVLDELGEIGRLSAIVALRADVRLLPAVSIEDGLLTLLHIEAHAPVWRLHAASELQREVDTPLCHALLALLVVRTAVPHYNTLAQQDAQVRRDVGTSERTRNEFRATLGTALELLKDALADRFAALTAAMRDGVQQTRALIRRYGITPNLPNAVHDWMGRRPILQNALMNLERLYTQMHNVRDYYRSVRACAEVFGNFSAPPTADALRDAMYARNPNARRTPGLAWQVELASAAAQQSGRKDADVATAVRETLRRDHIAFLLDNDFSGYLTIL